ncbi:MAG: DUF2789 domain-containing protein [Rhodocyclaceae bacterium]|nr:DUF2789 domain-containing protein [Rhodocyclaceae bacterium]MBX3669172.1 DUF2789 domain-containing protein [Rhodocyclaceae bacterium]
MESQLHTMTNLFAQLGLASDVESIDSFIETHSPLSREVLLEEASFWTSTQACFLREEILDDADWAEVIDELNARLRAA